MARTHSFCEAIISRAGILAALLFVAFAQHGRAEDLKLLVDVGRSDDDSWIIAGFHHREGPRPESKMPLAAKESFRWTGNGFMLRVPVFPDAHNELTFHMSFTGRMLLSSGDTWHTYLTAFGRRGTDVHSVTIPRDVVGDRTSLVLCARAVVPRRPGARDKRILFALIDRVVVRPVDSLPDESAPWLTSNEITTLNRLRGVERRPVRADADMYVAELVGEHANVVTMGAMYGTGAVFFPSAHATPHPNMDPEWIPRVTGALHEAGLKALCWVVFNVQDVRNIDDFIPAKRFPEWRMHFIEEAGKDYGPRVGMCLLSSPYIDWHAQILREAAAFDFDGFFFDGFYLSGIPHPSRPGCVCEYCRDAFKHDTGLDLPARVDWSDLTFKRWVRWRNERLIKTARFFQSEMKRVNPDITCTFNYNMWPFARKDWETAIPAWRIDDFGVSQHGYTGRFEEKWLMMGFKSRLGRDLNPAHTDMWRAASLTTTCGKGSPDLAWHKHELLTFLLTALSHGITPWHSTIEGTIEFTASIHDEVAKREPYFSRGYVCNVGVLFSQNTHDFYGHIPETDNLAAYRDGLLGTWMVLSENHIPFEFVFDNQLDADSLAAYEVLLLPNTAALSDASAHVLAQWVERGGHLIATAETGAYDEWGQKRTDSVLTEYGLPSTDTEQKTQVEKGRVSFLPQDPGLAYCRQRDQVLAQRLVNAINRTPMPFDVEAPNTLVVNAFRSPDKRQWWIHFLNVSAFMPGGDSGFRGLDRAPAPRQDTGSDAQIAHGKGGRTSAHTAAASVRFKPSCAVKRPGRLVIAGAAIEPDENGMYTLPEIDLHDILILEQAPGPQQE